jgi:hypothetical protein
MDTLPIPQPTGNPILDNPALKAQLAAQMQQTAQPQGAVMPPALKGTQAPMIHPAAAPAETQPPAPVQMPNGGSATPTLPQEQSSPKPLVFGPVGQVAPDMMAPKGTLLGDQQAREQSMVAGPGINSIAKRIEDTGFGQKHPLLGKIAGLGLQIPAMIGDIGLESLSPIARLALSHVPGTFAHQAATLHGENQENAQDEANAEKEAQTAGFNAEVPLREAQTEEAKARTAAEPTPEEARAGRQQENALKDAQIQNYLHPQAKTAFEDWRKANPNAPTEDFFKAEAAGKPEKLTTPQQQAFDSYVKSGMSPQQAYEKIREKPASVHIESPTEARAAKNDVLKAYQPTLDSAERMNVMTESYEKAIKDHDQQAMLNLLANHLGMTMGLQKGARLTKDIITEAKQSQPWLQGIQAKFDKDGYLSGVTLSPPQMRQMVELGQSRYAEDAKKSRATAQYLGAPDDGPVRVPGKATINYYLGLANGDPNKAKQLAAEDGWTVK